jgi:hypothetical protein
MRFTGSLPRLSVEMGLMAVTETQLWHHLLRAAVIEAVVSA